MKKLRSYPSWPWLIAASLMALAHFHDSPGSFHFYLSDAGVYATAIRRWMAGGDPYSFSSISDLPFHYPPIFLFIGAALARLLKANVGWSIYVAVHVVSTLTLPWMLYRHYLKTPSINLAEFYLLFFFSPGFLGLTSLVTGNIATICYAAMIFAGIRGLKFNDWRLFYLAVFCCSSIKIAFLAMLLVPLLCGEGQFLGSIACAASTVSVLLAQHWVAPSIYSKFVQSLQIPVQTGDVGKSLFGILFHVIHNLHRSGLLILPMLAYSCMAIGIVAIMATLRVSLQWRSTPPWNALVVIGSMFVMPRLDFYDLCIAFPLAFSIFVDAIDAKFCIPLYILLSIPSLYFLERTRDKAMNGGFEALAILFFWGWTVYRLLASSTFANGRMTTIQENQAAIP